MMNQRNPRILIVDDEEKIRKVLGIHLRKAGYDVAEAESAEETYRLLRESTLNGFDVIICDIKMPKISGIDLLEGIKKEFSWIPVIVLTGLIDTEIAIDVMRRGAFDYQLKPVRKDELVLTVEKALRYRRLIEENIRSAHLGSIRLLISAIEHRNPYKEGHNERVKRYTISIAERLSFSTGDLWLLEYSALLHDIGEIAINGNIFEKKESLMPWEYEEIKRHPIIGEAIVRDIDFYRPILSAIRSHHERYDGGGYPDKLKGEEIPLSARIIAVAESFDAMTSGRPFREARSRSETISILKADRGAQLDPDIVDIFIHLVKEST